MQRRVRLAGVPAAAARTRLPDVVPDGVSWSVEPHGYLVDVVLRAAGGDPANAAAPGADPADSGSVVLDRATAAIEDSFGPDVYTVGDAPLGAVLVEMLRARGSTCSTAESCTGGWLGATITAVPGASEVYWGGAITYDDAAKRELLAVPPDALARAGAVSREVALAMARGIIDRSGSDWGVAVTGVAGPAGGSEAKPVGTVWIAVCGAEERAKRFRFPGGRANVRRCSVQAALDALRRCLATSVEPLPDAARRADYDA